MQKIRNVLVKAWEAPGTKEWISFFVSGLIVFAAVAAIEAIWG